MSQFATALSWVPMSRNLAATMARACDYATQQAHRQVTLEHLLLALTDDSDAAAVLAVSSVDLGQLGADVAGHVSRNDNRFGQHEAVDPAADETLVRILDYAAAAARQSRRREINGAVVLAAVIGDGNSTAATILKAHGLTFEAAIKALQRSSAQPKAPAPEPALEPAPAPVDQVMAAAAPAVAGIPAYPPPVEPPSIGGVASQANEAMLANVRRKLEATRAAAPARPAIAPITPLAPPPVPAPLPVPNPPAVTMPAAAAWEPVNESGGLAALSKPPHTAPAEATLPAMPNMPTKADAAEDPAADQAAPDAAPAAAPATAGSDLAKTHEGWLPPPSPTLVTEATKPARRTPPVPVAETRAHPPDPLAPRPTPEWAARTDQQPGPRVSQDAGPPRAQGRSPAVMAPWPESIAPPPLSPAPPYRAGGYQDHTQPPRQTTLREFQPLPAGAVAGPDGVPYQPLSQQPNQGPGRPNMGQMPGPPGATGQWPPQAQMPPQSPLANGGQRPQPNPASGQGQPQPSSGKPSPGRTGAPAPITASVGKLTQTIPAKWRVSQAQAVEIRLSSEELRALAQQLDGRGAAYAHEKIIAKAFSVRLKASEQSFAIEPTSPETLWLDAQTLHMSNDGVFWRWQATPQTSGKTKLQLVISARTIGADGVVAETALPDQSVTVKVGAKRGRVVLKILSYLAAVTLGAMLARYGEGGIETVLAWKRGFQ